MSKIVTRIFSEFIAGVYRFIIDVCQGRRAAPVSREDVRSKTRFKGSYTVEAVETMRGSSIRGQEQEGLLRWCTMLERIVSLDTARGSL